MELVAKVEEEACRLARETAGGGKGKVGCDQEGVNVFSVDVSRDCFVVAGGASVLHDGAVVRGEPEEAEDSGIQVTVGGAQVMDGNVRFVYGLYFCEVKERGGRVSDCDDGARVKSGSGDQIVMWWRRVLVERNGRMFMIDR